MNKRLMRSNDRVIAGVCGGIAEYLDFDPEWYELHTRFSHSLQLSVESSSTSCCGL